MTLDEIRTGIDRVDSSIKELFIERMDLAKNVARVKAQTADAIYKPDRETVIIERQSAGMDEELSMEYKALIKRVMEISRKYQYGLTLKMRDCFPYSFSTQDAGWTHLAMVRDELFICDFGSKDDVVTVEGYAQIGDLIRSGAADGGAGILEQVGIGVNDQLNTLLWQENLYINQCHIIQQDEQKYKVVAFTKTLVVKPEHNRLKLVFTARNKDGALASLLSMIADYGVNVTQIHSIPYIDQQDWNYRFFVELNLNLLEEEAQALVFQLSEETQSMQILGSYLCEGDFSS